MEEVANRRKYKINFDQWVFSKSHKERQTRSESQVKMIEEEMVEEDRSVDF